MLKSSLMGCLSMTDNGKALLSVLELEIQKFNYIQMFIEDTQVQGSLFSQHCSNALLPAGMGSLNVLFGFEESQASTLEFRKLGHNAFSCDLKKSSGGKPEWHLHLDIVTGKQIGRSSCRERVLRLV